MWLTYSISLAGCMCSVCMCVKNFKLIDMDCLSGPIIMLNAHIATNKTPFTYNTQEYPSILIYCNNGNNDLDLSFFFLPAI